MVLLTAVGSLAGAGVAGAAAMSLMVVTVIVLGLREMLSWRADDLRWRTHGFSGDGRCLACGYSLAGIDDRRCPECGRALVPRGDLR